MTICHCFISLRLLLRKGLCDVGSTSDVIASFFITAEMVSRDRIINPCGNSDGDLGTYDDGEGVYDVPLQAVDPDAEEWAATSDYIAITDDKVPLCCCFLCLLPDAPRDSNVAIA